MIPFVLPGSSWRQLCPFAAEPINVGSSIERSAAPNDGFRGRLTCEGALLYRVVGIVKWVSALFHPFGHACPPDGRQPALSCTEWTVEGGMNRAASASILVEWSVLVNRSGG